MNTKSSSSEIAVLGGGLIGLATALRLLEQGRRVAIYAREPAAGTTSAVAAAFWLPFRVADDVRVRAWATRTRELYGEMSARGVPGIEHSPLLVLRDGKADPSADAWLCAETVPPGELPDGAAHGLRLEVPRVETPVHLPWLAAEVARRGGRFERIEVTRAANLSSRHRLVINCPGVGARTTAGDAGVYPIRGQIVRVERPSGLPDTILIHEKPGQVTYVVPRRHDCILGGTAEVGSWDLAPDPEVAADILRRAAALCPAVAGAGVLGHGVGLRPGRSAVRLELEAGADGRAIVHHYGHGGAGYTLVWACADEAAALAGRWLEETS